MHEFMNRLLKPKSFALVLGLAVVSVAPAWGAKKDSSAPVSHGPSTFAPMPEGSELASIWNNPDFQRRLIGSYGFASDVEPRMKPEEQKTYFEKIAPLAQEDPQKAIPALQSLVKQDTSGVYAFVLGNKYFQSDDLTNAIKQYEVALAKFPDYRRAQKNLAFALIRAGKYEQAIKPLTRTISLGGGDGRVFGLLGYAYMNQGLNVSAESAFRQALVFEPDNVEFKILLVRCAIADKNYDYALALLAETIVQYPERDTLWTLQANLFMQKELPDKAAISLEMLRRLGKATPANLFLLGDLYMAQEAPGLALGAYVEGIDKDEGKNLAKALRPAEILINRGAWDEAKNLFAKIRGAGPGLSDRDSLKLLKLESKVEMATGEGAKAIQTLEEIIQKNPLDGEALMLAGDYYARNGQPEKATFRYQSAGNISGFEADAYVKQAQLLVRSQKYKEAVELLRKAQKLKERPNVQEYLEKVEKLLGARPS
jgi:tetratricopeptide (TPR) repeat protein